MSLQYVRRDFVQCPACAAKPGSPTLCRECLERRELIGLAEMVRRDDRVPEGIRRAARLYPPTTFAEYERLGLREPSFARVQLELAALNAPRPLTYEAHLALLDMGGAP